MNTPSANGQLSQRDLYEPENVVPFLRSIASESIAGKQYARAAVMIESYRWHVDEIKKEVTAVTPDWARVMRLIDEAGLPGIDEVIL